MGRRLNAYDGVPNQEGGLIMKFQVGDKVEIVAVLSADRENNIKISDVAKIIRVCGSRWFLCKNPEWDGGGNMLMLDYQLKKL